MSETKLKNVAIIVLMLACLSVLLAIFTELKSYNEQKQTVGMDNAYTLKVNDFKYVNSEINSYQRHFAVAPTQSGSYGVYVANSESLEHATELALYMWHCKTGFRFHFVNSPEKAQLRIKNAKLAKEDLGSETSFSGKSHLEFFQHSTYAQILIDEYKINQCGDDTAKIVAHEIGHALGLGHSKNKHSIMTATDYNDDYAKITKNDAKIAKRLHNDYLQIKQ